MAFVEFLQLLPDDVARGHAAGAVFRPMSADYDLNAQEALAELIDTALHVSQLRERPGRDQPTVLT